MRLLAVRYNVQQTKVVNRMQRRTTRRWCEFEIAANYKIILNELHSFGVAGICIVNGMRNACALCMQR